MVSGALLYHKRIFKYLFGANQLSSISVNENYEINGIKYNVAATGIQGFRGSMEDSHTIQVNENFDFGVNSIFYKNL